MVDGSNVDTDVNVEVVEELDVELTKQLIIRGMIASDTLFAKSKFYL